MVGETEKVEDLRRTQGSEYQGRSLGRLENEGNSVTEDREVRGRRKNLPGSTRGDLLAEKSSRTRISVDVSRGTESRKHTRQGRWALRKGALYVYRVKKRRQSLDEYTLGSGVRTEKR